MMSIRSFICATVFAASIVLQATPASTLPPQSGAGDEATINANAMDLDVRIRAAAKAHAMPTAETARLSRMLAAMVRSAKDDLRRPPHFISAAENATYNRTISSVDAALKRVGH